MIEFFSPVLDAFKAVLVFLHDIFEPIFGVHSWGWAIIALTLIVRVLLLPLAIKQTRSMRAMQAIQPEMRALQKKYKVDRELMRKDPEQYRVRRAKLNEEMMALYKEKGANPAASCLPLLAQAPIFIALFWTLNLSDDFIAAPFYFFTDFVSPDSPVTGLAASVNQAGWPGWLLILLMSGTMFWTQRQMLVRNRLQQGVENPMLQQQKILMYGMPIFLAAISFQFPLGILLYWVTTNVWQVAQQAIILREVSSEQVHATPAEDEGEAPRRSPGASSGTKPVRSDQDTGPSEGSKPQDEGGQAKDGKAQQGKGKQPQAKGEQQTPNKRGSEKPSEKRRPAKEDGSGGSRASGALDGREGSSTNGQGPRGKRPTNGAGNQRSSSKSDHIPRRRRR